MCLYFLKNCLCNRVRASKKHRRPQQQVSEFSSCSVLSRAATGEFLLSASFLTWNRWWCGSVAGSLFLPVLKNLLWLPQFTKPQLDLGLRVREKTTELCSAPMHTCSTRIYSSSFHNEYKQAACNNCLSEICGTVVKMTITGTVMRFAQ